MEGGRRRVQLTRGAVVGSLSAAIGVVVVVVVARSTPSHPFRHVPISLGAPTAVSTPASGHVFFPNGNPSGGVHFPTLVLAILMALCALVLIYAVAQWLVWSAPARHRLRFPGRRRASGRRVEPSQGDETRSAVADAITTSLDELIERAAVPDAIIQCWLAVEAALAAAGLDLRSSDTSTDLVERALASFGVRQAALASLAALYREARFSTHALGEADRERARGDLVAIRADLVGTTHAR